MEKIDLPPDDAGPALQEPASAYPEARMLPRAAPRPRACACTLESSLRCLRTSDDLVLRGGVESWKKSTSPPTMLDRRCKSRHLLTQRRACCPGLPRGPEHAPAPWSPPSAACAPRMILFSVGVLKVGKNRPPPRRCWTGAARAGICLPRGAHAAPGCPDAPRMGGDAGRGNGKGTTAELTGLGWWYKGSRSARMGAGIVG